MIYPYFKDFDRVSTLDKEHHLHEYHIAKAIFIQSKVIIVLFFLQLMVDFIASWFLTSTALCHVLWRLNHSKKVYEIIWDRQGFLSFLEIFRHFEEFSRWLGFLTIFPEFFSISPDELLRDPEHILA